MLVELLAPGGNYESVIAAINAGADAVYTGGELFGARANANNLSEDELISAIQYSHLFNRKIYLTVNTLVKDNEIKEKLYNYLLPLYTNGLDAVIVQDIGVLLFIKEKFPGMHIHASTQMTIFGDLTVEYLKKLGVSRIVTPRELSLNEISDIHQKTNLEIESFVHGALCYCYSGQCFLSSFIGGRSGNRGQCAQPCRMEYDVILNGKVLNKKNEKYVLSPKDICTLKILPEVIESGVYSLKVEGRMKKPEYVAGVVSIYRKYVDLYLKTQENSQIRYKVEQSDLQKLWGLFNRNGFNESYFKQHNGRNMISLKKPSFRLENTEYISYIREKYLKERKKYLLDATVVIKENYPIEISTTINHKKVVAQGQVPFIAENKPITKETVIKQLSKLGNTDFKFRSLSINIDGNLFVPVGALNNLRRDFIEKTYNEIIVKYNRTIEETEGKNILFEQKDSLEINNYNDNDGKYDFVAMVSNKKQLNVVLSFKEISKVYLEEFLFSNDISDIIEQCKRVKKEVYLAMPYVFRKQDVKKFNAKFGEALKNFDGFLIRNIEEYFYLKEKKMETLYVFDYNVYAYNSISKKYYCDNHITTTSPLELNYAELRERGCEGENFVAYGYIPTMISANCCLKTVDNCRKNNDIYGIKDRLNNIFNIKCVCDYCYNLMYNCKPLSLLGYRDNINKLSPQTIRLNFTIESQDEVKNIAKDYIDSFLYNKNIIDKTDSTRGHFKRGVL